MGELISIGQVRDLLLPTSPTGTISRERADRITRRPSFPAPKATPRAGRLWDEDEVLAWIAEHRTPLDTDDTPR